MKISSKWAALFFACILIHSGGTALAQGSVLELQLENLLDQIPLFMVIMVVILFVWSVVLLVLYTLLPFSVFGTNARLEKIHRSLQNLAREVRSQPLEQQQAQGSAKSSSRREEAEGKTD